MRIATAHSYDQTVANLSKRQTDLSELQGRISTGKRVQRASDDPVAAVLSEAASNRMRRAETDQRSIEAARTSLSQAESAMGDAGGLIQDARELIVKAGNGTYGSAEFKNLAQQLEGLRERLIGMANQKDSAGRTLFGGLGGSGTPFVEVYGPSGAGVQFQGLRGQEAAGGNLLPQTFDGDAVFMRVPPGNGTFTVNLPATNVGSVTTNIGSVSDPSMLTGSTYQIGFADLGGGAFEYTITDTTNGLPVAGHSNVPYVSGMQIDFDGMSLQLKGQPQAGDVVDVNPVTAPTNVFQVMQNAIDALRGATGGQTAQLTQVLGQSLNEIDAAHDRVLSARAQAGEWLNRADSIDSLLSGRQVDDEAERSRLVDLDLVKGISDFQNQQTGLQAAMAAYGQVQKLSLFQYVS
jgi:flagellar hook-associated protein 3 FlgL